MSDECQQRGPVTREKLIEAAGEVFAEKGLYGARIRDITDRAGTNVAAVNYHFHDKFELYTVVLRQAHAAACVGMTMPLTAETPEGRIRQLLTATLQVSLNPDRPAWHNELLARELVQPTPALEVVQRDLRVPSGRLRAAVREMLPTRSDEDVTLAVCSIVAQAIFYVHHRHLVHQLFPDLAAPTVEKLVSHIVGFSLAALLELRKQDEREE